MSAKELSPKTKLSRELSPKSKFSHELAVCNRVERTSEYKTERIIEMLRADPKLLKNAYRGRSLGQWAAKWGSIPLIDCIMDINPEFLFKQSISRGKRCYNPVITALRWGHLKVCDHLAGISNKSIKQHWLKANVDYDDFAPIGRNKKAVWYLVKNNVPVQKLFNLLMLGYQHCSYYDGECIFESLRLLLKLGADSSIFFKNNPGLDDHDLEEYGELFLQFAPGGSDADPDEPLTSEEQQIKDRTISERPKFDLCKDLLSDADYSGSDSPGYSDDSEDDLVKNDTEE